MNLNGTTHTYQQDAARSRIRAVVLIAAGFDEQAVAAMMGQLRGSGLGVALVSTTAGLIRGEQGLAVKPDHSLESLPSENGILLVGVPGSKQSAMALLTDPRVHRLFGRVLDHDGRLAILDGAEVAFADAGLLDVLANTRCWLQGSQQLEPFTKQLRDYLDGWQTVTE